MEKLQSINQSVTNYTHSVKKSDEVELELLQWEPPQISTTEFRWRLAWMGILPKEEDFYERVDQINKVIEGVRDGLREEADVYLLPEGWRLVLNREGAGAAYFLIDNEGKRQAIIKPNDEDVLAMNNPKGCVAFMDHPYAPWINDYESSVTAVLAYEIAEMVGIGYITPKTELAIVEDEAFYLISDGVPIKFRERLEDYIEGELSKEKLVSIQAYLDGAVPFWEARHELLVAGEEFILDQADYEACMVLEWLTFENDGHMGNLMAVERGDGTWSVLKVDNALSLPEVSAGYHNALHWFDNGHQPLSEGMREKIANIPVEQIVSRMRELGKSESACNAFVERARLLQDLSRDALTIRQIDDKFISLGERNESAFFNGGDMPSFNPSSSGGRDEVS